MSYFSSSNKRGELSELYDDLNSLDYERKCEAVRKVIAFMTVGRDVSPLFQCVIKQLELPDLEIKKLVYLYIINYSRTKPDDAIMCINLFRKDLNNKSNALIRALAVRTMGCLRVPKLNDYLVEPLKDALTDPDAYVRKTAVLCVPKVFEISKELVISSGILDILKNILSKEGNALVLANTITALEELSILHQKPLLKINSTLLNKLLTALNECIEWGQVYILDVLITYETDNQVECESVIEKVLPRISHINPAVVLSAIKVILHFMQYIKNQEIIKALCEKITPPLVSLISNQPEITYCVLRNLQFIMQKYPSILQKDIKNFYCTYNDPLYVKFEKLDLMIRLLDSSNYELAIDEFAEYSNDIDVDFSRRAVQCIWSVAKKIHLSVERALSSYIEILQEIPSGQCDHRVHEIFIGISSIMRKYTKNPIFETVVQYLKNFFTKISEPQSIISALWILDEYCHLFENSVDILEHYAKNPTKYENSVVLQILNTSVKMYLKISYSPTPAKYSKLNSEKMDELMTNLLEKLIEFDNPDLRDRAFIYWRLLSLDNLTDVYEAINSKQPLIVNEQVPMDFTLIDHLIDHIGLSSSVFHKRPDALLPMQIEFDRRRSPEDEEEAAQNAGQNVPVDAEKNSEKNKSPIKKKDSEEQKSKNEDPIADLIFEDIAPQKKQPAEPAQNKIVKKGIKKLPISTNSTSVTTKTNPESPPKPQNDINLLDLDFASKPTMAPTSNPPQNNTVDLFENELDFSPNSKVNNHAQIINFTAHTVSVQKDLVLSKDTKGKNGLSGILVMAAINYDKEGPILNFELENSSSTKLDTIDLQIKPNYFYLQAEKLKNIIIQPKEKKNLTFKLVKVAKGATAPPDVPLTFYIGLKTNLDIFFFEIQCFIYTLMTKSPRYDLNQLIAILKDIPEDNQYEYEEYQIKQPLREKNNLISLLQSNQFDYIGDLKNKMMFICTLKDSPYIVEIYYLKNGDALNIACNSQDASLIRFVLQALSYIISNA